MIAENADFDRDFTGSTYRVDEQKVKQETEEQAKKLVRRLNDLGKRDAYMLEEKIKGKHNLKLVQTKENVWMVDAKISIEAANTDIIFDKVDAIINCKLFILVDSFRDRKN